MQLGVCVLVGSTSSEPSPSLVDILGSPDRDAVYGKLADGSPVVRAKYLDGNDVWLVLGYPEIVAVLDDDARFSNDLSRAATVRDPLAGLPDDLRPYLSATLAGNDPPDHSRLRKTLAHEFTFRRVEMLRPRMEATADELIAQMAEAAASGTAVDLSTSFASPFPMLVIGQLIGVPARDEHRWLTLAGGLTSMDRERVVASARGLIGYVHDQIALRADHGADDDLLSRLIDLRAKEPGRLDEVELASLVLSILIAGHRTTANLIRTGVHLLLHPGRWENLCGVDADEGVAGVVEELLRRHGPAEIGALRVCRDPTKLGPVMIDKGDLVLVVYATGNRDARQFADPADLDFSRGPKHHLAFGHGIHYCLGAGLARVMAAVALATLAHHLPGLRLAEPSEEIRMLPTLQDRFPPLPVLVTGGGPQPPTTKRGAM